MRSAAETEAEGSRAERHWINEAGVSVRPMAVRDLAAIEEIERYSFTTPWSRAAFLTELLDNRRARYLVAECEGQIVGYIGLWLVAGEGHVTNIAVHPGHRRRGIGRLLMQAMTDVCLEEGARRMTLEVRRSNVGAQNLYKSFGFIFCGVRREYYQDNGEDAFIMWRELDEHGRDEVPWWTDEPDLPDSGGVSRHRDKL